MKFEICNQIFPTKESATKYFMEYFHTKTSLTSSDKDMLRELLRNRNDFDKQTNFEDFQIAINQYNTTELQYRLENTDIFVPFSIKRCIVGHGKTDKARQANDFRQAVSEQILDYIKSHPDKICCLCKSTSYIQVDHFKPAFETIIQNFNLIHSSDLSIEKFQAYHKATCSLRYLCQNCNIKAYHSSKPGRKKIFSEEEYKARNIENSKKRFSLLRQKIN